MSAAKVKVEDLSDVEKKLSVEIPPDEIQHQIQTYYAELARDVKLPGFRAGKAPLQLVRTRFSADVQRKIVSHLIESSYTQALTDHSLFPVASPKIEAQPFEEGKSFSYTVTIEVKPKIDLKKYKGLEVQKEKVDVTKKEVEAALKDLQERKAELKKVEQKRVTQKKDFVVIDFVGTLEGKKFAGGEAKNFLYELGSGRLVADFEQGLLGMTQGEQKEIQVTFPKDFSEKNVAGKLAIFQITLCEIKEKQIPELTDALAKTWDGCTGLADLEKKLKEELQRHNDERSEQKLEVQLAEALVKGNPLTPPPTMVERQQAYLMDDAERRLESFRMPQALIKENLEKMKEDLKKRAIFDVQFILLLEVISDQEKIGVTPEEIDQHLKNIADRSGMTFGQIHDHYRKAGLLSQIRWQVRQKKTMDFLISAAKVTEVKPSK
ncbi:MAG: trigger factor [Deltaproteobacteria bacterium]|nr:trigger factor [Deltaproteobacteria bacterium]